MSGSRRRRRPLCFRQLGSDTTASAPAASDDEKRQRVAQAVERSYRLVAVTRPGRPGRLQGTKRNAGIVADDLVAPGEKLGDDGEADPAAGAGDEHAHEVISGRC